jgi:hypothetical protein
VPVYAATYVAEVLTASGSQNYVLFGCLGRGIAICPNVVIRSRQKNKTRKRDYSTANLTVHCITEKLLFT